MMKIYLIIYGTVACCMFVSVLGKKHPGESEKQHTRKIKSKEEPKKRDGKFLAFMQQKWEEWIKLVDANDYDSLLDFYDPYDLEYIMPGLDIMTDRNEIMDFFRDIRGSMGIARTTINITSAYKFNKNRAYTVCSSDAFGVGGELLVNGRALMIWTRRDNVWRISKEVANFRAADDEETVV